MNGFRLLLAAGVAVVLTIPNVWAADQGTSDLYKAKCQSCHGADGKATAIGKKLGAKDFQDPDTAKLSDAEMAKIIEQGKNKMPPYKGKLTDDQIKALVSYIKELK